MHGIGAHSAIAVKRQRRLREQQRKRFRTPHQHPNNQEQQVSSGGCSVSMFHIGGVFLLVGLLLLLASVITNETNKREIAELIGTGITCFCIGVFLLVLNRFYGQREDEELQSYVESRLGRTKSGQQLCHYQEEEEPSVVVVNESKSSGHNNNSDKKNVSKV